MAGRIPQTFIDDLMARIDIVDLVNARVPLKKSGRNYLARCPFHNEKTPSFTVNQEKQLYHCFGCGAGGTAIGFLMDYDHLGFVEAVEDLARIAGLEVPRTGGDPSSSAASQQLDGLYEQQKQVARFYQQQLFDKKAGREAVRYLRRRGVDGQVARRFQLGFAADGWENLGLQFDARTLRQTGLLVEKDNGRSYDRFRNRVMFPIRDRRGRVAGFGGRVLDDSVPKYLNSPETPIFQKSRQLYGLYELLSDRAHPERILVVEGYMDVIALAQNGVQDSVATLGTAVSLNHLDILFRYTSELVFCFDGDEAGKKAAWRAVEIALPTLKEGRTVRIMLLPSADDPDSFVREYGREAFDQAMAQATLLSDYFFDHLGSGLDLGELESCASLVARARPLISKLPHGVFRDMMQDRLKELVGVESVEFKTVQTKQSAARLGNRTGRSRTKSSAIRVALTLLIHRASLAGLVDTADPRFAGASSGGIGLLLKVVEIIKEQPRITLSALLERFRGSEQEKGVRQLAETELMVPDDGFEAEFSGALARVLEQESEKRVAQLLEKSGHGELTEKEREELRGLLPG
ncbi:MAG: DNA primase [Pseudomonadota bacterium]|nr:DNA primase [Pseudomonadota bacterium]